ncbi:MAG: hypothetical protein HZA93_29035 [Verrucomicrobia bacterium]|nr:hypothetical protein [Verrucomicrobiota bacterium]
MSVQEIKQQIATLSLDDQAQLESYLRVTRAARAPGFQEHIEAAHRRMDAGQAISSSELRAMLATDRSADSSR